MNVICLLCCLASAILGFLLGMVLKDKFNKSISKEKYDRLINDHMKLQESYDDFKHGTGEHIYTIQELQNNLEGLQAELAQYQNQDNPGYNYSEEVVQSLKQEVAKWKSKFDALNNSHKTPLSLDNSLHKKLKSKNSKLKKKIKKLKRQEPGKPKLGVSLIKEIEISKTLKLGKLRRLLKAGKLKSIRKKIIKKPKDKTK